MPIASGRAEGPKPEAGVDFNRHVRPILAEHCFKCHGADEKQRKGKLRLDVREAAIEQGSLIPGKPDDSALLQRVITTDEDDVMPPVKEHKALTVAQKETLRQWIANGAEYKPHWAFIAPVKPPVPEIPGLNSRDGSAIDAFVQQRLAAENLRSAAASSKERWMRRVTLDLTGLPPTIRELEAFLADEGPGAHDTVVDRLLASQSYGERMATDWLDAARYADTYGRHEDAESSVWRYRDWVVQAFNANMRYDQFLLWQTAGDLLPNPTQEQLIATAFNRLVQQSNEAGSNEEEFRAEHIADRVRTNATAILGLTLECARCHDHKYDPFTQRDYYSFSAFLNNIDELGLFANRTAGLPAPSLLIFEPAEKEARHRALCAEIAQTEKELAAARDGAKDRFHAWCREHGMPAPAVPIVYYDFESAKDKRSAVRKAPQDKLHPEGPAANVRTSPSHMPSKTGVAVRLQDDNSLEFPESTGAFRRCDEFSLAFWFLTKVEQDRCVLVHRSRGNVDAANRGYEIGLNQGHLEFVLAYFAPGNSVRVRTRQTVPIDTWTHITASYDGSSRAAGLKLMINGKLAESEIIRDNLYRDISYRREWGDFDYAKVQNNSTPTIHLTLASRYNDKGVKDGAFDEFKVFDRALTAAEAVVLAGGVVEQPKQSLWDRAWGNPPQLPANADDWFEVWLRDHDETSRKLAEKLRNVRRQQDDMVSDADEIMIMREMEPRRPTHILARGQFNQPGESVDPATPALLPALPEGAPRNRLGLAQWFVDKRNPLTARVAVNRIWQMFFGAGLVGTAEDFGTQGELASHPELLDWLACDFMEHGWDVKRLCRMIAVSGTYRQSSIPSDPALLERDPQNRLLARGPRQRLAAEQIRDTALAVSGLLAPQPGGRPAKPYQPEGIYEDSGIQVSYTQDHGAALWRRSLYTFRKRTLPMPNMLVFDSPTREFCRMRRDITNTPLQALTLMNDPQFFEACRVLAEKMVREHPQDDAARIIASFRLWTARSPRPEEIAVLQSLLTEERAWFATHPDEAETIRSRNGEAAPDKTLSAVEVAAMTQVERALLGDDETLVKQ